LKQLHAVVESGVAQPQSKTLELPWRALLAAARWSKDNKQSKQRLRLTADGEIRAASPDSDEGLLLRHPGHGWVPGPQATGATRALFDLYLPMCNGSCESPVTVGHLGQSLDGYIATDCGDSNYITGPQNILHLHRMRALCDAVVVGAETVSTDDPQLTTRLATGDSPVRVILDPTRRLTADYRVFSDGSAPTLLICDEPNVHAGAESIGLGQVVGVPADGGTLRLDVLLNTLQRSGIHSVFVEGGGATVSRFLQAGLLDRLHLAIAPMIIGQGRPGIRLPASKRLSACLRPAHRVFSMGADVLFDCDLGG